MKVTKMVILMAVIALGSCKKNVDVTEKVNGKCKIVSIKEDNNPASTYSYDDSGRIFKVTNLYGYGDGTFTYQSNTITFTKTSDGSKDSFDVNNSGFIIQDRFDAYKYNSDGYLIEKAYRPYPTTSNFELTYTKSNLTRVVIDGFETADINYYEDEPIQNLLGYESALHSSLIFNESTYSNFKIAFLGKGSKNLVKSISKQRTLSGVIQKFNDTYVYNKDADGKIVSIKITSQATGGYFNGVSTVSFIYQCQ